MAYTPTTWKNKIVERPRTFQFQQNADSTVTLIPSEGSVTEAGTSVNATNMNNIEQGITNIDQAISANNINYLSIQNYLTDQQFMNVRGCRFNG